MVSMSLIFAPVIAAFTASKSAAFVPEWADFRTSQTSSLSPKAILNASINPSGFFLAMKL